MQSIQSSQQYIQKNMCGFQNIVIVVLSILLFFSFVGVNLFIVLGNLLQPIFNFFISIIDAFLNLIGFSLGSLILTLADIIRDVGIWFLNMFYAIVFDITSLFVKTPQHYPTDTTTFRQIPIQQQQPQQQTYQPALQAPIQTQQEGFGLDANRILRTPTTLEPFETFDTNEKLLSSNSVFNIGKTLKELKDVAPFLHP